MVKKKKKSRKRKPKGKRLSESLKARDERRDSEAAAAQRAQAPEATEDAEKSAIDHVIDELASEPPPSYEGEENDERDAPDHPEPFDADASEPPPSNASRADDEVDGENDDEGDDDGEYEDEDDADAAADDDEYEDDDDDELDQAAAQMGHRRYILAGFFGLWIIVAYVLGRSLEMLWSNLASRDWVVEKVPLLAAIPYEGELISRESLSLVGGAIIGGAIVLRYYFRPDIRQWADEVAEQLSHVTWPTRKEVGNHTIVVMVASAIITLYLMLLDRFWSFVTDIIYTSGT